MIEKIRDWLEARGWWYGRLKPCDCPREDRYWGLQQMPPECTYEHTKHELVESGVGWWREQEVRVWKCKRCGELIEEQTEVVKTRTDND